MFERIIIKYFGHQPAAKITDRLLDKIIEREFPNNTNEVRRKLNSIISDSKVKKNRFSVAILKLANRDLTKIDRLIKECNTDFRDVVSKAEYPRCTKFGFGEISADKVRKIYFDDWQEYSVWLDK